MSWFDLLPHDVAKAQIAWERGERVLRARAAGATYRTIGRWLGMSDDRVKLLEIIAFRARRRRKSPVERYLDLHALHDAALVDWVLNAPDITFNGARV